MKNLICPCCGKTLTSYFSFSEDVTIENGVDHVTTYDYLCDDCDIDFTATCHEVEYDPEDDETDVIQSEEEEK